MSKRFLSPAEQIRLADWLRTPATQQDYANIGWVGLADQANALLHFDPPASVTNLKNLAEALELDSCFGPIKLNKDERTALLEQQVRTLNNELARYKQRLEELERWRLRLGAHDIQNSNTQG